MAQLHVSLAFASLPDRELDNFTLGVKDGMTGNPAYPAPPVALATLESERGEFEEAIAAAAAGGPVDTANKNNVRQELIGMLRLTIDNGASGQLIASISAVRNSKIYEGHAKLQSGDWLPSVFTGDSRHIIFNGLTPGQTYTIQVRALGGSTGASDWSDPSSHMCM